MDKAGFVYILTNKNKTTLYIGVTSNLIKRIWEHKNNVVDGFSKKYKLHSLIYYEKLDDIVCAIEREKQLKKWSRCKKESLIDKFNPERIDLYYNLF
ncbi:MAG: GIY-YIG nuclease family protein [Alphaproteobacteria bacterium]|jgi:putative endonuclease|nr:GIY-YIG nuclease family protein [Alphaproteobacteria bacterium]